MKINEKRDKRLGQLLKFYERKSKELAGGSFFIPVVRGRKLPVVWGRSKDDVSKWARKERFVIDKLVPLV